MLSGLRNAGTPFDTASTPDSATAPDENARRSMNTLTGCVSLARYWASSDSVVERDRAEVLDEHAVQADRRSARTSMTM